MKASDDYVLRIQGNDSIIVRQSGAHSIDLRFDNRTIEIIKLNRTEENPDHRIFLNIHQAKILSEVLCDLINNWKKND